MILILSQYNLLISNPTRIFIFSNPMYPIFLHSLSLLRNSNSPPLKLSRRNPPKHWEKLADHMPSLPQVLWKNTGICEPIYQELNLLHPPPSLSLFLVFSRVEQKNKRLIHGLIPLTNELSHR